MFTLETKKLLKIDYTLIITQTFFLQMSLYTIAILILLHVTIAPSFASSDGSCCTLGSATYEIKFTGLWVNNASYPFYPSNFPHWSPVIGAVHSPALTIYEYGKLASPEVKAVAESGVTSKCRATMHKNFWV